MIILFINVFYFKGRNIYQKKKILGYDELEEKCTYFQQF